MSFSAQNEKGGKGKDDIIKVCAKRPFERIGSVTFDSDRQERTGMKEVIYAPGKTLAQLTALLRLSVKRHGSALATRVEAGVAKALADKFPHGAYHAKGRIFAIEPRHRRLRATDAPSVAVVSAGAADEGVAEEAALTLEHLGWPVDRIYDVGVAGLQRVLSNRERLERAAVVIVVAGMEGALPSVTAGLISRPVIAVPTSAGYGANLGGIAPLLGMLNSCAGGVAVVNIDGGFNAACVAHRICATLKREGAPR